MFSGARCENNNVVFVCEYLKLFVWVCVMLLSCTVFRLKINFSKTCTEGQKIIKSYTLIFPLDQMPFTHYFIHWRKCNSTFMQANNTCSHTKCSTTQQHNTHTHAKAHNTHKILNIHTQTQHYIIFTTYCTKPISFCSSL